MDEFQFAFRNKTYSLSIKKIGQEHCLPRKKHELRKRDYYSLHFVLRGFGTLYANGQKNPLNKGNIFLLFADEEYEYYPDANDPWSYIWIDFYGEGIDDLFGACGLTRKTPYVRMADYADIVDILKSLVEKYNGNELQPMVCSAYTVLLLARMIEYKSRYGNVGLRGSVRFKQFRDILVYVNNNYRMNLTLAQIAEDMCISEKQLVSMFHAYIGLSLVNYINKFRISNACELLKKDDLKIETVAGMVGVSDEKYFSRMFTKWKGMSPREYRKNSQEEDPFDWLKEKNLDFR